MQVCSPWEEVPTKHRASYQTITAYTFRSPGMRGHSYYFKACLSSQIVPGRGQMPLKWIPLLQGPCIPLEQDICTRLTCQKCNFSHCNSATTRRDALGEHCLASELLNTRNSVLWVIMSFLVDELGTALQARSPEIFSTESPKVSGWHTHLSLYRLWDLTQKCQETWIARLWQILSILQK